MRKSLSQLKFDSERDGGQPGRADQGPQVAPLPVRRNASGTPVARATFNAQLGGSSACAPIMQ
eukprot:14254745-Heterocapsa_arctica.AAC.1